MKSKELDIASCFINPVFVYNRSFNPNSPPLTSKLTNRIVSFAF